MHSIPAKNDRLKMKECLSHYSFKFLNADGLAFAALSEAEI
jgi:hypothetical protein